ncbi:MAG: AAA family ATPase, partial [Clostridia bacterium]|nr:AAA family ATPase [Clostridia bacterium]
MGGIIIYIDDFISRLDGVKRGRGSQYTAKCPAHDDRHSSLSVSQSTDGKILLNCFAGCTAEQIVSSLGLKLSDLFSEQSKPQFNTQFTNRSSGGKAIVYDYTDDMGNVIVKKLRYPNKAFCWLHYDTKHKQYDKGRPQAAKPLLYNSYACKGSEWLYIVEGEKDVDTLKRYNKAAVSFPDGCQSKWYNEYSDYFRNKTVAIIQDNDTPGKEFAKRIAAKLFECAKSVRIIDLTQIWEDMPEKADVTDYLSKYPNSIDEVSKLANNTAVWSHKFDKRKYIFLSEVTSKKTEWLWYPYIPSGKLTILAADPGTGKTFFSLYLAAQTSTGRPFYGQELYNKPGVVVYQTAEDGIADTLKPRLEPMNPNFDNIVVYDESNESLSFSESYQKIEDIMQDLHPKLMIFDPLQAYLGADVDMHRANEVRPVMRKIGDLAEKYKCAVLLIMHNNKNTSAQALYRALGSIDITAIVRSQLIMAKDPNSESGGIILCHEKSSLARHGQSILFEIDPERHGIVWNGFSNLTADDVLTVRKGTKTRSSEKKDTVTEHLLEMFGNDIFIAFQNINELCAEMHCSKNTLYRARDELNLQSCSIGFGNGKRAFWLLPGVDIQQF